MLCYKKQSKRNIESVIVDNFTDNETHIKNPSKEKKKTDERIYDQ